MCNTPRSENDLEHPQAAATVEEVGRSKNLEKTDSLRSWLVCAVCTIVICGGSIGFRCSGEFLVSMAEEFKVPRGEASWPASVNNLCMYVMGMVAGPLAQRFPLKPVLFVGAAMTGLGFALASIVPDLGLMVVCFAIHGSGTAILLVVCNTLLTQYFDRFRGLAHGIAHAASPLSSMVFPPFIHLIKKQYGFRYALAALGVLLLTAAPLTLLVNDAPWVATKSPAKVRRGSVFAWSVFREPMFYILLAPNIVLQWTLDTFLASIVDYGTQRGLTVEEVFLFLACFSVSDILGRLFLPVLADWGWMGRDTLLALGYFLSCAFMVLLCTCSSLWHFIAAVSILGGFFGSSSSYFYGMVARYIGSERLPFTLGMFGAIGGLVFLIMPLTIGFFKDRLNDYRLMFLMDAALLFVTSVPLVGVVHRRMIGRSLEVDDSRIERGKHLGLRGLGT